MSEENKQPTAEAAAENQAETTEQQTPEPTEAR